jgi:segregation and condensation protein B
MEKNELSSQQIKNILEAALLAADYPLSIDHCMKLFEGDLQVPERSVIKSCIEELQLDCQERGVELVKVASGFRYQTRVDIQTWVARLHAEKTPRYSRALMETLALVVYKQPITRAEIEDIRGVSVSSNIMKVLQEREWVKIVGHKEVPGRPAMFATTKKFLDYFNLQSLNELPTLADIKEFDQIAPELDFGQDLPQAASDESQSAEATDRDAESDTHAVMDQDDSSSQSDESQTVQAVADNMADNLSDEDDDEDEDDGEEDFSVSEVAELNEEFDELNELDPSTEIKH